MTPSEKLVSEVGFAIVHVYGQHQWHDEAVIAANTNGLRALRDAIDQALSSGAAVARVMVEDGEGYRLGVIRIGPERFEDWRDDARIGLPYIDPVAGEDNFPGAPPEAISNILRALSNRSREG